MDTMRVTDGNWIKFYNKMELKIAEQEGARPEIRKRQNLKKEQKDGLSNYHLLKRFSQSIRDFFEPKLESLSLPGIVKLGVAVDHRVAFIYHDEDEGVVLEKMYVDTDGLHYAEKEALNPSLVLSPFEYEAAKAEAISLTEQGVLS